MLHACVEKLDVMGERGNILGWAGEVNKARTQYQEDLAGVWGAGTHVI
jgi:hypothetical protein